MRYYDVEDVMEITGKSQNKAYEIIRELNKLFRKEFPKSIFIQGQIPKWYFEEAMGFKGKGENHEKEISSMA